MLAPIYVAVGFAAGFITGVKYGNSHRDPWNDLAVTLNDLALWTRRTAQSGPRAPDPDAQPPREGEEPSGSDE